MWFAIFYLFHTGHHGGVGAPMADVILPERCLHREVCYLCQYRGPSSADKSSSDASGLAREDWKIIRALSEVFVLSDATASRMFDMLACPRDDFQSQEGCWSEIQR